MYERQVIYKRKYVYRWNFLTIRNEYLAQFAFLLFDKDDTGSLDTEEVIQLVYTIHNTKKQTRVKTINNVVDKLRETKDIYSVMKFEAWLRTHMSLMEPVQILQRNLRMNIIGEKFWYNLADIRAKHEQFKDIRYILQIKRTAIDIREHQIRTIYLHHLEHRKNAEMESDIVGAPRLRGRRTTSMLNFFRLLDEDGRAKGAHKSGKKVTTAKKGVNRKKIGPCSDDFHSFQQQKDLEAEEDKEKEETDELANMQPAPPLASPAIAPMVGKPRDSNKKAATAALKDVVQLPSKPRRRRSSLFGRPDLRRKEEPKGVRAIRKRRRHQHQPADGVDDNGEVE